MKVLSHKEQRRLKKKQKLMENEDSPEGQSAEADESKEGGGKQTSKKKNGKEKKKKSDESESQPKRQNSVWVGNLSFKTTEEALKNFFDGVGEITRVHMPKKSNPGAPKMSRPENRGCVVLFFLFYFIYNYMLNEYSYIKGSHTLISQLQRQGHLPLLCPKRILTEESFS